MIRHLAALAVVVCVNASPLFAQGLQLTVKAATADIHKFPSIGSPVIGKAPRGTVLEITREIGDWMRVWWPDGENSAGYVHKIVGSIARESSNPNAVSGLTSGASTAPAALSPQSGSQTATDRPTERSVPAVSPTPSPLLYIVLPNHVIGLGTGMGTSSHGFKASARGWSTTGFGFQFEVSRDELTSALAPERVTSFQFAPSILYSLPASVTNRVWVRPYLGGGASIYRATLNVETAVPPTDSGMDFQAFAGGEITLANVPRFALSADIAFRRPRASFVGFETRKLNLSVSGHWYIK